MRYLLIVLLVCAGCSLPPALEAEYKLRLEQVQAQVEEQDKLREQLKVAVQQGEVNAEQFQERLNNIAANTQHLKLQDGAIRKEMAEARGAIVASAINQIENVVTKGARISGNVLTAASPIALTFLPALAPILGALGTVLRRLGAKNATTNN